MGLWRSKEQKDISISNPQLPTEVFVTDDAITNIIKTTNESKEPKKSSTNENKPNGLDLRLLPDLHDKRIIEYEKNLIEGLNKASKEVENLFRERYTTMPVCLDLQQKVSQCYSDNPKLTLNCLDIANQFIKCVEQERQNKFGLSSNAQSTPQKRAA